MCSEELFPQYFSSSSINTILCNTLMKKMTEHEEETTLKQHVKNQHCCAILHRKPSLANSNWWKGFTCCRMKPGNLQLTEHKTQKHSSMHTRIRNISLPGSFVNTSESWWLFFFSRGNVYASWTVQLTTQKKIYHYHVCIPVTTPSSRYATAHKPSLRCQTNVNNCVWNGVLLRPSRSSSRVCSYYKRNRLQSDR